MNSYRVAAWLAALALLPSEAMAQKVKARDLTPIEVDPSTVQTPALAFTETDDDRRGYDKYFYFTREGTSFAEAYRDVRECDALARGVSFHTGTQVPYAYAGTMAGALGGAIGSAMADAIFGSAERRRLRRVNLRTCMGFKGYARFGLNKDLWQSFNFEEGNRTVPDEERQKYLQMQAKAAIAGRPSSQELEF
jgi:hypothetical protein